jgi:hypothetical protein
MRFKKTFILMKGGTIFCLFLLAATASAFTPPTVASETNKSVVEVTYQANLIKYKDNPDMLVLPGLVADRKAGRVILQAECDKLTNFDPVEFILIATNSGHSYESLAISFAKPSDIHKALVFIGMQPGRSVNPNKLRFWPKGERVFMTFAADAVGLKPTRAEKLLMDMTTGKALPETGFVFVGSMSKTSSDEVDLQNYAADTDNPGSICSTYNEAATVLDVPRQAAQGEYYGRYHPDRSLILPTNVIMQVILEPEFKDGRRRVMDLSLAVNAKTNGAAATLNDLEFRLTDQTGKELAKATTLNSSLEALSALPEKGREPFVSVRFDGKLPIKAIHDVAALLSSIETENGIRIEPPQSDDIYYKAYTPDETFRDRSKHMKQPWELHLSSKGGKISGKLVHIEQLWHDDKDTPELKTTEYEVASPDAVSKTIAEKGAGLPVILIFVPGTVTKDDLLNFIKPVRSTHPTIHVFVEE